MMEKGNAMMLTTNNFLTGLFNSMYMSYLHQNQKKPSNSRWLLKCLTIEDNGTVNSFGPMGMSWSSSVFRTAITDGWMQLGLRWIKSNRPILKNHANFRRRKYVYNRSMKWRKHEAPLKIVWFARGMGRLSITKKRSQTVQIWSIRIQKHKSRQQKDFPAQLRVREKTSIYVNCKLIYKTILILDIWWVSSAR